MSYDTNHPARSLYFENKKLANRNVHMRVFKQKVKRHLNLRLSSIKCTSI